MVPAQNALSPSSGLKSDWCAVVRIAICLGPTLGINRSLSGAHTQKRLMALLITESAMKIQIGATEVRGTTLRTTTVRPIT